MFGWNCLYGRRPIVFDMSRLNKSCTNSKIVSELLYINVKDITDVPDMLSARLLHPRTRVCPQPEVGRLIDRWPPEVPATWPLVTWRRPSQGLRLSSTQESATVTNSDNKLVSIHMFPRFQSVCH